MSQKTVTVLVLAVGGNVSQGILKALALSSLPCRVIGADISPMKLGLYTVDRSYLSPWAHEPGFLDWLTDLCLKENVQAILTGAEAILPALAREAETIRQRTGAVALVSNPATLSTGDDKLLTCQWLEKHGFACPAYARSEDAEALRALAGKHGYPLIAKPIMGGGCRGLVRVDDEIDLAYVANKKAYLVQQFIGDAGAEFTAGGFCDREGCVRGVIVMHRELHEGTTVQAEAGEFPVVRDAAVRIIRSLRPQGPCNIQLRVHEGRPTCFEINVRFSGTTPLRARWGFNEVELALRHYVLGEPAYDLPVVTRGVMLRYWNELYVDPEACEVLRREGRLDTPQRFPVIVEDYGITRSSTGGARGGRP